MAWNNSTAGTSARGTAANTPELQFFQGMPTNKNIMTNCRNSNTTVLNVVANQGTYLGTFLTSSVAGQVNFKFGTTAPGGGAACICLFNAFNQTLAAVSVGDSTVAWTYSTTPFRQANGSAGNEITVVQGAAGSPVDVTVTGAASNTGSSVALGAGIGIDTTTVSAAQIFDPIQTPGPNLILPVHAHLRSNLSLGLHNLAWLEESQTSGTTTWFGQPFIGQTGLSGTFFY
jgi:hypothetical protein